MPFFTPRTEGHVPTTTWDDHPGNPLLRFYGPWQEAQNVYRLTNGTITEVYPINNEDTLARVYQGGANRITAAEAAALTAAGYGTGGNGTITYEDMLIEGQFVWQLMSGETLLQVSP